LLSCKAEHKGCLECIFFSEALRKIKHYVTRINFILEKVRRSVVQFIYILLMWEILRPNLVSSQDAQTNEY
jgi:hypothetical protein